MELNLRICACNYEAILWRYFEEKEIKAYHLRKQMESHSLGEQHKRNNVEAAMFQYSFHTRNGKTRYRSLLKHRMHIADVCG